MKSIWTPFAFLMLLLVALPTHSLWGQNFQTVYLDREGHFESETFGIHPNGYSFCNPCRFGIRVEELSSDSSKYVFPVYWEDSNYLYYQRASWLGDTLQRTLNGEELFRNKYGAIITLKPKAGLGEQWEMFQIAVDTVIEATVTNISYEEVFNQMDSVKHITLMAKEGNGNVVDHPINNFIIKIGQHTGFIQVCDMFHFPEDANPKLLIGLTNPDMGEPMLNAKTIFDFNIGDEKHYYRERNIGDQVERIYKKSIVLEREEPNAETRIYTYNYFEVSIFQDFITQEQFTTIVKDTIIETIDLSRKDYNSHSFEFSKIDTIYYQPYTYVVKNNNEEWFKIAHYGMYEGSEFLIPNKQESYVFHYQKCIGMTYYEHHDEIQFGPLFEELVYYKKGNTEWGSPIDFDALVATKEIQNPSAHLIAYPNPAQHNITITSRTGELKLQHIQVFNTLGQQVAHWDCAGQEHSVHAVADFPTGTYWLLVTDEAGGLWRLVFVKEE